MGARNQMQRHREKAQEAAYREWIAPMAFCVVSGTPAGVELAHIRHHTGMGMKPPPRHTIPLCRQFHTRQETDRSFFADIGIPDIIAEAEHLFELFELDDATGWATRLGELNDMVNREAAFQKLVAA